MKKLLLVVLVALVVLVPAAAQSGNVAIGPVYSINALGLTSSPLNGLGITGKIPGVDPVFGLNFSFSATSSNFLGVTADWVLYKQPIYQPWNINFFMGPGLYTSILIAPSFGPTSRFDLGLRIPFGVNFTPVRFLEFFLDATPAFGITFQDPITPGWLFQAEAGARVWF